MDGDRRDFERIPILGTVQGEVMLYQPMTITEIGLRGATVETSFPLHLDSLHELRLTLGARAVIVKGRVVHSRIIEVIQDVVTYSSGVEFVEPSERITTALSEFLASIKTNRGVT